MKKIRVLAIDGGGIRGIIPATIIKYIENKFIEISKNPNIRISDCFDMIVGTSTGGILACLYLTPNPNKSVNQPSSKYSANDALDFYKNNGFAIFNHSKKNSWFGIRQIFNSTQYSPKTIEKLFEQEFGMLKMKDLLKRSIITTYDLKKNHHFSLTAENL